jgi:hypothetical protein
VGRWATGRSLLANRKFDTCILSLLRCQPGRTLPKPQSVTQASPARSRADARSPVLPRPRGSEDTSGEREDFLGSVVPGLTEAEHSTMSAGGATPGPTSCASRSALRSARREPQHRACGTQPVSPESAHREIDRDEDHRQDQADREPRSWCVHPERSDGQDDGPALLGVGRGIGVDPEVNHEQDCQDAEGEGGSHERMVRRRSPVEVPTPGSRASVASDIPRT